MEIKGDRVSAKECQTTQDRINNEQEEQRKTRRIKNKEAAKEKAIDLFLKETAGKGLTKDDNVLNTEASTSAANEGHKHTK